MLGAVLAVVQGKAGPARSVREAAAGEVAGLKTGELRWLVDFDSRGIGS